MSRTVLLSNLGSKVQNNSEMTKNRPLVACKNPLTNHPFSVKKH